METGRKKRIESQHIWRNVVLFFLLAYVSYGQSVAVLTNTRETLSARDFGEEKNEETKSNKQDTLGQLVSALVWKMLKWFSVYIGLSEGIELITEDQKQFFL